MEAPRSLQKDFIMDSDFNYIQIIRMSLLEYQERVFYFVDRIKESFQLVEDTEHFIHHKKKLTKWLEEEISKVREEKEKINSAGGLQGLLNLAGLGTSQIKKVDSSQLILLKLKDSLKNEVIQFDQSDLAEFVIPQDILQSFHYLDKKRILPYFGIASCPLMKSCFIMKKESYDKCVTKVTLNQLKCINLGSQSTHVIEYQRYMIEHLFNRLFNQEGQLTTVLKIQIQNKNSDKVIEIYCCIEDLLLKPAIFKSLDNLKGDTMGRKMWVNCEGKDEDFDDLSLFHAFMTQLVIVPIQTVVSDYVLTKEDKKDPFKEGEKQDIFTYMREHPSLRNPLSFFASFIKYHEFKIDILKNLINPIKLYANFYEILTIIFRFLENDFTVKQGENRSHSLCITDSVFKIIWNIFHQVVVLSNWLDEVINPIKDTVTMSEIKNKLYPIFNETIKENNLLNYQEYQNNLLNLPIQNYLSSTVSKLNIQKYKDRYISLNWIQPVTFSCKNDIFNLIFCQTLKNYDLRNTNIYESIYFLNFIANNYTQLYNSQTNIEVHLSWKNKKLWKDIVQLRNSQNLQYLSISLDLLALTFDFDSLQFSSRPFEQIKNQLDQSRLLETAKRLFIILKEKYEKKSDNYLSFLIERSFKYKKYQVVKYLIECGVHIKHYQDIFTHENEASTKTSMLGRSNQKTKLIELMQVKYPEMFRRFRWEELINVKLKQEEKQHDVTQLITIGKGKFEVHKKVYSHLTSKNVMNNTLSRKDYMFCNNRLIAKINIEGIDSYIELTEYPLLRYFYSFFLKQLEKESLVLNFCGFFSEKGNLFHLIQCVPECFNFQKGLQYQNESDLKNFMEEDDLSEAIIISMILMPTNIQLRNIIISPHLFIVDFFDFYQKNGFEINGGNIVLKIKNSLFLFDQMNNSISSKLLKKYSEINVMKLVNDLFTRCSSFIREVNGIRPRNEEAQRQLYSLIFQKGYAFSLAERLFKIKNACLNSLKDKKSIDHFDLLDIIDPQLRYYYEQIIKSSNKLIQREKNMLDESFKHSFIVSDKLVDFFAKGKRLTTELDNFPQHYMKFNFQGPSQNLKYLHEEALKFNVFNDKITSYKSINHDNVEYFIRHIDLSRYTKEEREELFDKLQEYSLEYLKNEKNALPLSVIRITYIQGLKERKLKFSDERLKDLIFQKVSCSEGQFNRLIKKYQNISYLELKGVTNLEKIGELYINTANSLEIKNLKILSITNCSNLETIDIKCDELEHLTLRNNTSLTHIYIHSKKLRNMDCSQCSKLRLQNIGIYIFQKINVLLCKNSCDGDVKRLQHPNYSIYLTRILRYLCNRFEESNQYKLDLVITLNKLELLDQKFYRFGNTRMSSNVATLLNFITKAARETLRVTQRQIIEIFLSNANVDVLSIDELLKVQIQSLTNIVDSLRMTKSKKLFKEICFREVIKNPTLFNDHLRLIKEMFETIQVEKVFKIRLTIFPQIETQYYIALIEAINQKEDLQKLEICFENSFVDYQFFQRLFNLKNKIWQLEFSNCQLQINENVQIDKQPIMKDLIINHSKLGSLTFIQKFVNLNSLQLNNCAIDNNLISPFYLAIAKLQHLKSLALVSLKKRIFQNDLQLPLMFELFKNLPKLQQLDFSGNLLNFQQLSLFSQKINSLCLKQLILNDFYQADISSYIKNFLHHDTIRIIHIEFKIKHNSQILQSFFNQLAANRTIIKLKIKTDREIPSGFCEKLKLNKVIQQIQSNQPIPNWLKNHIASNSENNQSGIFESEPFEILASNANKKEDFYRIGLSLDGGGVRGLLLATQLDYICRNVKQPLHKIFDCIGGTSIGGILALASTGTLDGQHPVCSTKDLMDIFEIYGNKIFKKSQIKQFTNLFETKYDVSSFQDLLNSYFKDSKLSDTLRETNVVVTTVNRLSNEDMIFRSINAIFDRNKDFYMRDIARATSAAPTYFPSAEIKNVNATEKYSLIDGGVGLNNPSKLVIDDIIKTSHSESKSFFQLSLGTGRLKCEAIPQNAGIVNLAPIIDSLTESANFFIEKDLSENYKGHYLRLSPLINLNRKDAELDNTSPDVLKIYKQTALTAAEEEFSNKIAYGKFKNQSFVEWLAENTARKYDI